MPEGMTKDQLIQLLLAQLAGGQNPYPTVSGNVKSPYNVAAHYVEPLAPLQLMPNAGAPIRMMPLADMGALNNPIGKDQAKQIASTGSGLLDMFKKKPGVTFGAGNYIIPRTQIQSMPNLGFSSKFSGNLFASPAIPKFNGNLFGR